MIRRRIGSTLLSGCNWYDMIISFDLFVKMQLTQDTQMQAAGSPPADLVGDMNAAQETMGDIDSGCPQQ